MAILLVFALRNGGRLVRGKRDVLIQGIIQMYLGVRKVLFIENSMGLRF